MKIFLTTAASRRAGLLFSVTVSLSCSHDHKNARAILKRPWLATEAKQPAEVAQALDYEPAPMPPMGAELPVADIVRYAREDDEAIRILTRILNQPAKP